MYLDEAGSYELLGADVERTKLCTIVELRRDRWRALLCGPAAALTRRAVLDAETHGLEASEALSLLQSSWKSARGHAALSEAVAMKVDALDLGGVLADRLEPAVTASGDPSTTELAGIGRRLRDARNEFACSNLRLVVRIAARHADERMSLADRVQEGNLGLLIAVSRFDPDRGFRFSTYATWWIRFAITRALVNRGRSVRIPAHLHAIFGKARQAEQSLRAELAHDPTDDELAAATGIPVEKLLDARAAMESRVVGLDDPDHDDGSGPAAFAAAVTPDHDAAIDDRRNLDIAQDAFASLDPMERDIIEHRFGLQGTEVSTLSILGERHALSRERIRQLQNQALAKLRRVVESSPIGATAYA
jgi:RNA polymerase sigma factor (sigma-70 family)